MKSVMWIFFGVIGTISLLVLTIFAVSLTDFSYQMQNNIYLSYFIVLFGAAILLLKKNTRFALAIMSTVLIIGILSAIQVHKKRGVTGRIKSISAVLPTNEERELIERVHNASMCLGEDNTAIPCNQLGKYRK